jgi:hypothetical protein
MDPTTSGRIMIAVANPKQFLFAPFELAIINIVLALGFMLLCIGVFGLTPFWAMLPMVGGHLLLVVLGARNPHLTTTLQATGKFPGRRKNRIGVKIGVKYTP